MLRRTIALLAALAALLSAIPAAAGGAGDLNDYGICSFSRSFPVYTGPGENYFRVDGSAKYGSGSCRVWGISGDWLMVGFLVKSGKYRVGYITKDALSYAVNVSGKLNRDLNFLYEEATVVKNGAPLTDDPVLNNERFCYMEGGQRVTVLGYYGNWAYVETNITTAQRGRGFVRKFNLNYLSAPTAVPTAAPTAGPTPMPVLEYEEAWPNAATPLPTVGTWARAEEDGPITFATWVPQATVRPEGAEDVWSGSSVLMSLSHNCPNTGEMLPAAFDPYTTTYLLTVASWVSRVNFTPTAADPKARITVNGEYVLSGTASAYITLNDEPKRAEIVVWGTGGSQTVYTVYLQRKPSAKKTEVTVGYIRALVQSGKDWVLLCDPVEVLPLGEGYMNGARSIWVNTSAEEVSARVDPHCEMWYGTADSAYRAASVPDFAGRYSSGGAALYYIVYLEDEIVAVMPYASVE